MEIGCLSHVRGEVAMQDLIQWLKSEKDRLWTEVIQMEELKDKFIPLELLNDWASFKRQGRTNVKEMEEQLQEFYTGVQCASNRLPGRVDATEFVFEILDHYMERVKGST